MPYARITAVNIEMTVNPENLREADDWRGYDGITISQHEELKLDVITR